ncbi:MAG: S8/S53 family peptidase [Candidatus Eremiobacteraeota bacterium]|nr:S8/S53 family peptidase [Candidatus Eremiobacteraeota bacterium]
MLTEAQTTQTFGQTSAAVQSVVAYLKSSGFSNVVASSDALTVTATGTVAQAESAFKTKIDSVKIGSVGTFVNVVPAYVPSALGGLVTAVEGLSGATMHSDLRAYGTTATCTQVPAIGTCVSGSLSAAGLRSFYDVGKVPTASKTTLATIAAGSLVGFAADVQSGEAAAGIKSVPVTIVPVGVASKDASALPEWDTDAETALGVAGGASRFYVYDTTSLGEADVTAALERFESDDVARAASISFGICEDVAQTDGSMLVDDTLLALAALHGQTLFAATGDLLDGCPAQQYPASSPYAVAVGGTTVLLTPNGPPAGEVAWPITDGGASLFETAPFWQSGITPASAGKLRAVPDLVLDGDPNSGALVVTHGTQTPVGGTSVSAPLALGLWGRLESAHGNALGFAATRLYHEYADLRTSADATPPTGALQQTIGGFNDLLLGTNGLPATPEFDFATGLGSLNETLQSADITR